MKAEAKTKKDPGEEPGSLRLTESRAEVTPPNGNSIPSDASQRPERGE